MSSALQLVLSNPNPGLEAEFNIWYAGDHLLHGVETPGVLSGQRFYRADGPWPSGKHDYMMIWELDDPATTLAELAKVKGTDKMPISPGDQHGHRSAPDDVAAGCRSQCRQDRHR